MNFALFLCKTGIKVVRLLTNCIIHLISFSSLSNTLLLLNPQIVRHSITLSFAHHITSLIFSYQAICHIITGCHFSLAHLRFQSGVIAICLGFCISKLIIYILGFIFSKDNLLFSIIQKILIIVIAVIDKLQSIQVRQKTDIIISFAII
jgi:hypothetical protein